MFKAINLIFIFLLFFSVLPASAQSRSGSSEKLKVGIYHFPPHVNAHGEEPTGPLVDLFEDVARGAGAVISGYQDYPFQRLLLKIGMGTVDAALYIARTPQRETNFRYPRVSIDHAPIAVAIRKDNGIEGSIEKEDLFGLRVGYLEKAYLPEFLNDYRIRFDNLSGTDWLEKSLRKLEMARIDAVMSDYYRLHYALRMSPYRSETSIHPIRYSEVPMYIVFSENVSEKFISEFEAVLIQKLGQRTYKQIYYDFIERLPSTGIGHQDK